MHAKSGKKNVFFLPDFVCIFSKKKQFQLKNARDRS